MNALWILRGGDFFFQGRKKGLQQDGEFAGVFPVAEDLFEDKVFEQGVKFSFSFAFHKTLLIKIGYT